MPDQENQNLENNNSITRYLGQHGHYIAHMAASVPISTLYMMLINQALMPNMAGGHQMSMMGGHQINMTEQMDMSHNMESTPISNYLVMLGIMGASMLLSDATIAIAKKAATSIRNAVATNIFQNQQHHTLPE